jgi:hypothetical protein
MTELFIMRKNNTLLLHNSSIVFGYGRGIHTSLSISIPSAELRVNVLFVKIKLFSMFILRTFQITLQTLQLLTYLAFVNIA